MQRYRGKTVITTPMNLALVSSLEFTERAQCDMWGLFLKKKKLFKHFHRRAVSLIRLLNKGATI